MDVVDQWQFALDAAKEALDANVRTFPAQDLHERQRKLAAERVETQHDLEEIVRDHHPWLAPFPLHPSLLGLGERTRACIFDLDGVLTDSGVLHAAAWAEVFDDLLLRLAGHAGWQFVPFDTVWDYAAFVDGRPRREGIRQFLKSRGIQLSHDEEDALARAKDAALGHRIRERGVNALPGARLYLEAVGRAHLGRAVVSSSTRTLPMLEIAGLALLVDARVDAEQIAAGELQSRPAPDLLLRACRLVDVDPEDAVSLTHSPDGVAAAHAAGMHVIGVGDARLLAFGAERVVPQLSALLDRRLAALAA